MPFDLSRWILRRRQAVDGFLRDLFADAWPPSFAEPLRYPMYGGGKRMRPALAIAAYEALGSRPHNLAPVLPAAAALELVHTYSLVHDDLPAMDDDDERRGRPTVHVKYDEATAILVGDALLTEAFRVLTSGTIPAERKLEQVEVLAQASGAAGMVGGQVGDIQELDDLEGIHQRKTGALITAAVKLGGLAADAPDALPALDEFGKAVGLAFQLADDLLDGDGYVARDGAEAVRTRAHELADRAVAIAQQWERPEALVALARYTVERDR